MARQLRMDRVIAVGFGEAFASRDGFIVYQEAHEPDSVLRTVGDIEAMAAADPDHNWVIVFNTSHCCETWKRVHGAWTLVDVGEGFA